MTSRVNLRKSPSPIHILPFAFTLYPDKSADGYKIIGRGDEAHIVWTASCLHKGEIQHTKMRRKDKSKELTVIIIVWNGRLEQQKENVETDYKFDECNRNSRLVVQPHATKPWNSAHIHTNYNGIANNGCRPDIQHWTTAYTLRTEPSLTLPSPYAHSQQTHKA